MSSEQLQDFQLGGITLSPQSSCQNVISCFFAGQSNNFFQAINNTSTCGMFNTLSNPLERDTPQPRRTWLQFCSFWNGFPTFCGLFFIPGKDVSQRRKYTLWWCIWRIWDQGQGGQSLGNLNCNLGFTVRGVQGNRPDAPCIRKKASSNRCQDIWTTTLCFWDSGRLRSWRRSSWLWFCVSTGASQIATHGAMESCAGEPHWRMSSGCPVRDDRTPVL